MPLALRLLLVKYLCSFLCYAQPTTLQLGDASAGPEGVQQVRTLKSLPAQFDATGLVEQQFQAISEDGTKVKHTFRVEKAAFSEMPFDVTSSS